MLVNFNSSIDSSINFCVDFGVDFDNFGVADFNTNLSSNQLKALEERT